METLIATITAYGIKLIGVVVLMVVAWIFAGLARSLTRGALTRVDFDDTLSGFFETMAYWAVLLMGVLSALGVFGVETTSFAAVLGAAGLAIGLAFQGSLSNLAAGIMLLTFRPFKVGQVVSVAGKTGKIISISLFTTEMDTPQNVRLILPNSSVFGSTIENISFHETRRVDVNVGTDYSADLDETRKVLESVIDGIASKLEDGAHQVVLTELGASSIDWQLRIWVEADDFWGVREEATTAVKKALDKAEIGIPFPQMDVHLDPPCKPAA